MYIKYITPPPTESSNIEREHIGRKMYHEDIAPVIALVIKNVVEALKVFIIIKTKMF